MDEIDYAKFDNYDDFDQWCREGGWDGAFGFTKSTGIDFSEIRGKYFQVVHNRVYIMENQEWEIDKDRCPHCGSEDVEPVHPFDYVKQCNKCDGQFAGTHN